MVRGGWQWVFGKGMFQTEEIANRKALKQKKACSKNSGKASVATAEWQGEQRLPARSSAGIRKHNGRPLQGLGRNMGVVLF